MSEIAFPEIGSVWRHNKTNHVYLVTGMCRLEETGRPAVLYSASSSELPWARDLELFMDGRFTLVEGLGV